MILKLGIKLVCNRIFFYEALSLLTLQRSHMEGLRAKTTTHKRKALLLHIHAEVNADQLFFFEVTLIIETFLTDYWDSSFGPLSGFTKLIVNFIFELGLYLLISRLDNT